MDQQTAFLNRLEALTRSAVESTRLKETTRSRIESLFEIIKMISEQQNLPVSAFASRSEKQITMLPRLLVSGTDSELLSWTRELTIILREALLEEASSLQRNEEWDGERTSDISRIFKIVGDLEAEIQITASMEDASRFAVEAEQSALDAESAARTARSAAGLVGEANLSLHFEQYAAREMRTANWFRASAVLTIVATIVIAIALPHPNPDDVSAVIYRLAQLLGVAGLATYLGRQAGQHRRVGNWAESLHVQLKSFTAFIEPLIEGPIRDEIHGVFARRLLGDIPERPQKSGNSTDAHVLELLAILAKRE